MKKKRIAFISECASPLLRPRDTNAVTQSSYIAELVKQLARQNHVVDIFTRLDEPGTPQVVNWIENVRVIHIKAGPAEYIPKENLLSYMTEFRENMICFAKAEKVRYDLVHAHSWVSALVAMELKLLFSTPFVVSVFSLDHPRIAQEIEENPIVPERANIETQIVKLADQLIAVNQQGKEDLINYYKANPQKITIIPAGMNPAETLPGENLPQNLQRSALKRAHTHLTWQVIAEFVAAKYEQVIVTRHKKMLEKQFEEQTSR